MKRIGPDNFYGPEYYGIPVLLCAIVIVFSAVFRGYISVEEFLFTISTLIVCSIMTNCHRDPPVIITAWILNGVYIGVIKTISAFAFQMPVIAISQILIVIGVPFLSLLNDTGTTGNRSIVQRLVILGNRIGYELGVSFLVASAYATCIQLFLLSWLKLVSQPIGESSNVHFLVILVVALAFEFFGRIRFYTESVPD